MHTYIHTYIHIDTIHTCNIHVCTYTYTFTHTHTYIHTYYGRDLLDGLLLFDSGERLTANEALMSNYLYDVGTKESMEFPGPIHTYIHTPYRTSTY